jgi:ATP-dependent Lon protease
VSDVTFEAPAELETEIELPATLPVLPLKETVVFPQSMTPLAIGQERSVRLIDDVVAGDRLLALVTARDSSVDVPGWDDIYEVGTVAVIHKMIRVPDGTLRILVGGLQRIRIVDHVSDDPYLVAELEAVPDEDVDTPEVAALTRNVQGLFSKIIGLAPYLPEELQLAATNVDDPSALAHLVASTLRTIPTDERQRLLETVDVEQRLRQVSAILSREVEVFELGSKIQSQVQSEMEKGQREYFLRQQLKAIQDELGEGDPEQAEVKELRERLDSLELPEEVRKAAERELARLERLPSAAAEYGVIRSYLEWILTLPWGTFTEDNLDLDHARKVLDADHFDLEKVKDRIIEYLAVAKLRNEVSGQILCFVGPPGVGKTSLGQSIARALGRKFVRMSVGGVRDEAEIRGHRRTYIGALPGTIIRSLRDAESLNPVMLIDEIDKLGSDWRGDPSSAMLEVLDPEQNKTFRDHYLDLPFDLSKVLFICTANTVDTIPGPLLDRMDTISLSGYTEAEKLGIAKRYLLPKQLAAAGLKRSQLTLSDTVLRTIIREYTREAGVRNLERRLADVCRKAATQVAKGKTQKIRVAEAVLGRGAQAHRRPRRRNGTCVHGGRRRRPVHRSGGLPGQGRPDRHGPARRGDAGVRARSPLLGAFARRRARCRRGLVREPRHPHPRSGGRGAQGRTVGRRDDGDRDRVAHPRAAGRRRRRDDGRDHADGSGAADRRHPREVACGATGWAQARDPPARERGRARRAAAGDARGDRLRPCRHDRGRPRRRLRRPACAIARAAPARRRAAGRASSVKAVLGRGASCSGVRLESVGRERKRTPG